MTISIKNYGLSGRIKQMTMLTGAGKAFCPGADLKTFIPKGEKSKMLDFRKNVSTGIGGDITRGSINYLSQL
jgi:hypothetical protein